MVHVNHSWHTSKHNKPYDVQQWHHKGFDSIKLLIENIIERDFSIAMYCNADVAFWFIQFYYDVSQKRVPPQQRNETLSVGLIMNP